MAVPNMVIVYVSDAPASARFYSQLFDIAPSFETPRFISFPLTGGFELALWSGVSDHLSAPRTSELCVTVDGGPEQIDRQFREWAAKGVKTVEEPHDEVFGRTFVVADPDGNLIRVAPVD
ncbi:MULTISPECIES: VOC family protein [Streptomyces]|uniref:VOC family protein n=1 Tax=Streptomyces sudanensis TaxID=436397 RepID=A0ABY4T6V4_9ACTN|nr:MULTISPECIES: VOC family protein [Streptomyces]MCP9956183.1 VOC family protein [Streptomyces sudanensis]MCP9985382.1 VOC family protein [Streptomyces sudanensis]MCQ0003183.1 VOC family protein [Streptomyces sudanensis]URN14616.1 VOC family protein [Streptomyces sudanensis]